MITKIVLLKRKSDMSQRELTDYWVNKHAPMVRTFPEIRKYVMNPANGWSGETLFDGVAELWYDDMESTTKLERSRRFRDFIKDDNPKFQQVPKALEMLVDGMAITG